jgi:hypothetical protein
LQHLDQIHADESFIFGDRRADSDLGPEMERIAPVTVFRTMCAHQGCLIAANMLVDPGLVRRSSPGFPGTWPEDDFVYPDSNGAEVTAVASHAGFLLAFTENAIYDITPDRATGQLSGSVTLAMGVGCVAPRKPRRNIQLFLSGARARKGGDDARRTAPQAGR